MTLPEAIKRSGLKKDFLALKIGLPPSTFTQVLNGNRILKVNQAIILAEIFSRAFERRVSVEELFGEESRELSPQTISHL